MNNNFSIDEQEMNGLAYGLGKALVNSESTASSMSSDFNGLTQAGLLGGAINSISNNLDQVSSFGLSIKNKILEQTTDTFQREIALSNKLDEITVPQDFVKNDTRKYNSIDDIQLSKKDDKAINADNDPSALNEIADNSIKEEEKLKDIRGEDSTALNEIADNSIKEEQRLQDVRGKESRELNEIDDNSIKEEQKLKDNRGEESRELNEIDDNSIKEEQNLQDITGEKSRELNEIDNNTVNKEQLFNINNNETVQTNLDESLSSGSKETLNNVLQQNSQTTVDYSMPSQINSSELNNSLGSGIPSVSNSSSDKEDEEDKRTKEILNNISMYENFVNQNENQKKESEDHKDI